MTYASIAMGDMAHAASVALANSSADPRTPDAASSVRGVTVGESVGFDSLFMGGERPDESLPFVVRVYKLDVNKRSREWAYTTQLIGGGSFPQANGGGIPLRVVQYIRDPASGIFDARSQKPKPIVTSIRVEPTTPLAPGEYAFVTPETETWLRASFLLGGNVYKPDYIKWRIYSFGIDQ